MEQPLLEIKNLAISFVSSAGQTDAVRGVGFSVAKGETVALVGESGSGKSVSALSILQLLPATARITGDILFDGQSLLEADEPTMRAIRGQRIGMIFQEPLTALNPLHTIEKQIAEPLLEHRGLRGTALRARVLELLDLVGLGGLHDRLGAYPYELSGGQRQRVMIAMALANEPDLLIADEPTTALDVTVQAQILELLKDLKDRLHMGLLLITHDLGIVEKMADRVCVMQQGQLVESGVTAAIFDKPTHLYTQKLLKAHPTGMAVGAIEDAEPILEGTNIQVYFPKSKNFFGKARQWVKAVDNIDIVVKKGQTLGVVGESGSGKSTLGYCLLRLVKPKGKIVFMGREISTLSNRDFKDLRADMQIVFQDPFGSLSPRMVIGDIVAEGLIVHTPTLTPEERVARVVEALQQVRLDPAMMHRYPHELSGGQRQRISIARALILKPEFIVMDEPTSALDATVQAEIVDLLRDLQQEHGLSYLFISHDLRVVRALAHDIVVMKDGKVVESGSTASIFSAPQEEYTRNLLNAALNLKAA